MPLPRGPPGAVLDPRMGDIKRPRHLGEGVAKPTAFFSCIKGCMMSRINFHAESRKFNRRLIQRKGPSDGSRACRCPRLPWPYSRAPAGACARSCAWLSMLSSSLALVISGRRPLRFEAMRACPPHMPEATSISCLLDVVDTGVAAFMPRRSSDSKRFDQVRLRV